MSRQVTLRKENDTKGHLLCDNVIMSKKSTMINLHHLVDTDSVFNSNKPKICLEKTKFVAVAVSLEICKKPDAKPEESIVYVEISPEDHIIVPANSSQYKLTTYTFLLSGKACIPFGFICITGMFTAVLDEKLGILTFECHDNAWAQGSLLGKQVGAFRVKTVGFKLDLWYED